MRVVIDENSSVLDTVRETGQYLTSECGGRGTCGKCKIALYPAPAPTEQDLHHLTQQEINDNIRLACEHSLESETRAVLLHARAKTKILISSDPDVHGLVIDEGLAGQFGVAVDIGTTTIVAYLLSLEEGLQIGSSSDLNPQIAFGEDVISRITFANEEKNGHHLLQERVVQKVQELIVELCEAGNVKLEKITRMSVVGNTTMHHLFLGLATSSLGVAPYEPVMKAGHVADAAKIGFENLSAEVYCAPNIAGFVGGDITAFIISQRPDLKDEVILGIDIGTNGEIVLSNQGEIFCCSTAAGSAFEGATISQGMRAQDGAIEHVSIRNHDESTDITIIGHGAPLGLCGSAIVDVVAELRRVGLLDEVGRMSESRRTIREDSQGLGYIVVDFGEHGTERRIVFTQKDVRQIQLAKGAIRAGAQVLLNTAGLQTTDIDQILLAGAFGNYINPKSALTIGLLPAVDIDQIFQVGNTAGAGAKMLLLSSQQRDVAEEIARSANYIELASNPEFADLFVDLTRLGELPQT